MSEAKTYDGILFIGDPHTGTKKPGRRKDESFAITSLNKLDQSLFVARELNYLPIILGDLINRKDENSMGFMAGLIAVLSKSPDAICPLGNHDKSEVETSDFDFEPSSENSKIIHNEDPIQVVDSAKVISLIHEPESRVFEINGQRVGIYFVPYGYDIPKSLKKEFRGEDVDFVIMVTHHDLAFDPQFAHIDMKEIDGCDMVVNGHLHKTFPPQTLGQTKWFNPGNILRISVTEKDHVPSVWRWDGSSELHQHVLEYEKDIFDMTGYLINADKQIQREEYEVEDRQSEFVRLLKAESSLEISATDDGSVLAEDIETTLSELEKTMINRRNIDDVRFVIEQLHQRAISGEEDASAITGLHIPEEAEENNDEFSYEPDEVVSMTEAVNSETEQTLPASVPRL